MADLVRLQFYGALWAGSGIDQVYPKDYAPAMRDFEKDDSFKNIKGQTILSSDLALDIVIKWNFKESRH